LPTAPLDTLESVVNTARSRLNDAIVAIGGEIFTDNSAFGLTAIIAAWRRTQEYLASRGFQDLIQETIFKNVTACASPDQGQFVWFNWTQYFDGNAPHNTPVFPQNMIPNSRRGAHRRHNREFHARGSMLRRAPNGSERSLKSPVGMA